MHQQMTIGKKLIGSFGAMLAAAIALSMGAFWQVRGLTADLNNAVKVTARKQALAGEIQAATSRMLASEENLMLGSVLQRPAMVSQAKDAFRSDLATAQRALTEYESLVDSGQQPAALTALVEDLNSVSRAHDEMMGNLDRQQFDQVQKAFDELVLPRAKEIGTQATNLVDQEKEHLSAVTKSAEAQTVRGNWIIGLLFLTALAAGAAVLWVIQQINRQLRGLAGEVGSGCGAGFDRKPVAGAICVGAGSGARRDVGFDGADAVGDAPQQRQLQGHGGPDEHFDGGGRAGGADHSRDVGVHGRDQRLGRKNHQGRQAD
jgi:Four helix bundle sensory module for signal transduction